MAETGLLEPSNSVPEDPGSGRAGLGLGRTALPLAGVRCAGLGAEFVAFALLARRLGPTQFGLVSVAFLVARYLGLFADWGASYGGSRLLSRAEPAWAEVRRLVRWRTALSVVLGAAFLVVALAWMPAVAPIALTVVCRGMNRDWISLGRSRGGRSGASSIVQGAVLVLAVVVLVGGRGVGPAAWAITIGYLAGAGASILLNRQPPAAGSTVRADGDRDQLEPWVLIIQVADQFLATADTAMIALLGSQHAAGLYAAVCRIPNAVITAQGLIVLGLVPGVSRYLATRDPIVIQRLRRKCLAVGGEAAAVVVVGIPVAIWMLPRIFGSAFASGRFALVVLLLAAAVSVATTALFPIALGLGRDRAMCAGYVGVAVVNVVANLVVIPRWSYNGAAVVMLGSQFALAATYLYTARIKEPA